MRAPQIAFPVLIQDFFLRRLIAQRGASARTVEAYRDGFELLFGYLEQRTGKSPSALSMADLDAPLILDFLDHLETSRGNSIRTRNARLAAIHSFMRYAAVRDPASLPVTARVLAIPAKRFDRPVLGYLSREQVTAILTAPDRRTWSGRRDAVLLATAYNTGARVSELSGLRVRDILLDRQTAVHLHGKGRKQRIIPLWKNTAAELRSWLDQLNAAPDAPVFPSRAGAPLTRSGIRDRLDRAVTAAERDCPSLRGQHVTPAHAPALDGHAPAAIGHGPGCHRVVARAFQPGRHASVSRSRPGRQGSSTTPARPTPAQPQRGSSPATGSSRSWKVSDYVQPRDRDHPAERGPPNRTAHNRELSRIGNVADHFLARCGGREIPVHQVRDRPGCALLGGGRPPRPRLAGDQAQLAHELADQLPAGHHALAGQLRGEAPVPVRPVGIDEYRLDQPPEPFLPFHRCAFRA